MSTPKFPAMITVAILAIVWPSARTVFTRMLDGVDPAVLEAAEHTAQHVPGVRDVAGARARWSGHRLLLEIGRAHV